MNRYELSCMKGGEPSDRCCKKCHDRGDVKESELIINGSKYIFSHCCNYTPHINSEDGCLSMSVDCVDAVW